MNDSNPVAQCWRSCIYIIESPYDSDSLFCDGPLDTLVYVEAQVASLPAYAVSVLELAHRIPFNSNFLLMLRVRLISSSSFSVKRSMFHWLAGIEYGSQ